jgi:hypothetical protein
LPYLAPFRSPHHENNLPPAADPQTQRTLLDWLRAEYGIEKPSKKLLALTDLDSNTWGQSRKLKC